LFSLNVHSNYSILKGTIRIEEIVDFARKTGNFYAVLTDDNGMYGLIQFAKKAEAAKIKPVLGAKIDAPNFSSQSAVVIAKNNDGYAELCRLITARKLKKDFQLDEALSNTSNNVFVITSSVELMRRLLKNKKPQNLFAELIITRKQKKQTKEVFNFARRNNLKVVASHPAYFLTPEDYLLHKTVSAIRLNSTLANLDEDSVEDEEYYLKSPLELENTWQALPEALRNAEFIARESNVNLKLGEFKYPYYPLPPDETAFSYLWKIAFKGLEERYQPITEEAVKRLNYELEVIDELGFSDYFLIVWDIVSTAKKRNMLTIGRGSAANSLVAYCLGLTQVDPLKHNLYFERFLNRARLSPPDVDIDFSWKDRDEIVRYVFEKYGYDKVAMISTTVTFRARSAFRETAKVFGVSDSEISRVSKFIPWTSARNLLQLKEKFPETTSLRLNSEPWKSILKIAARLGQFPRHISIHPSGIVISREPIVNYLALEYAKNKGLGLIVTQPDMYSVEDFGLVKIDLLSQRALGVLKDALKNIQQRESVV